MCCHRQKPRRVLPAHPFLRKGRGVKGYTLHNLCAAFPSAPDVSSQVCPIHRSKDHNKPNIFGFPDQATPKMLGLLWSFGRENRHTTERGNTLSPCGWSKSRDHVRCSSATCARSEKRRAFVPHEKSTGVVS